MGCQIWQEHLCYLHSILQDIPFLQHQVNFLSFEERAIKVKITFNNYVIGKFYDVTKDFTI